MPCNFHNSLTSWSFILHLIFFIFFFHLILNFSYRFRSFLLFLFSFKALFQGFRFNSFLFKGFFHFIQTRSVQINFVVSSKLVLFFNKFPVCINLLFSFHQLQIFFIINFFIYVLLLHHFFLSFKLFKFLKNISIDIVSYIFSVNYFWDKIIFPIWIIKDEMLLNYFFFFNNYLEEENWKLQLHHIILTCPLKFIFLLKLPALQLLEFMVVCMI